MHVKWAENGRGQHLSLYIWEVENSLHWQRDKQKGQICPYFIYCLWVLKLAFPQGVYFGIHSVPSSNSER